MWRAFFVAIGLTILLVIPPNSAEAQITDLLQVKPGQPLPHMGGRGILNPKLKAEEDAKYRTILAEKEANEILALQRSEKPFSYIGIGLYDPRQFSSVDAPDLTQGPWIISVESNSPASAANLMRGDIIIAVDGKKITSPVEVVRSVAAKEANSILTLTILRDKQKFDVSLSVGRRQSLVALNADVAKNVYQMCMSGVIHDKSEAEARTAKRLCSLAIIQSHEKTNYLFLDKLKEQFFPCDATNSILSDVNRQKIYHLTSAIDLSDNDLASILRIEAFCSMNEKSSSPASFVMWQASLSVLKTYGADRRKAKSDFVETRFMIESLKLKNEREAAHIASLSKAGYKLISLQDLKIDARALHGEKVAVRGLMIVLDNNSAALLQNNYDANPVGVFLGDASRETRERTIGNCTRLRGCQIEIRGTVVGNRNSALIVAD